MKEDRFIRENNEKTALRLAFKELRQRISKEMVRVRRLKHTAPTKNTVLVLGVECYNLLFDAVEGSLDGGIVNMHKIDFMDDKKSTVTIYDMPIYVSVSNEDLVEIVISGAGLLSYGDLGDFKTLGEWKMGSGDYNKRMDKYISKLPEGAKFKRIP